MHDLDMQKWSSPIVVFATSMNFFHVTDSRFWALLAEMVPFFAFIRFFEDLARVPDPALSFLLAIALCVPDVFETGLCVSRGTIAMFVVPRNV